MSAVLYHFPKKTKISEDILEKYAELIRKNLVGLILT